MDEQGEKHSKLQEPSSYDKELKYMRKNSGKAGIEQLSHLPHLEYIPSRIKTHNNAIYTVLRDSLTYDFLLSAKSNADRLFVLFSGDALRKRYKPPVFQRWSWSKNFPGHCLYFSDPVLYLSESIGLAWYSGTQEADPLEVIAQITLEIADSLGISPENICTYGSSGGGFAALRFTSIIGSGFSICINPQIKVYSYLRKHFDRYLSVCYPSYSEDQVLQKFIHKLDITHLNEQMRNQQIIYVQNRLDSHHYQEHYIPFCKSIGDTTPAMETSNLSNFKKILFDNPEGHAKGETSVEFERAINILQSFHE